MHNYQVNISDELNKRISKVSTLISKPIEEILAELVSLNVDELIVKFVIEAYHEGKLKVREAWKATGLDYAKFQLKIKKP